MKRNRFYISLLAALLVLLTAAVVFAAPYLTPASGGGFETGLEGWAPAGGSGTILHNPNLAFVRTGTGSASINAPTAILETYKSPCFLLTGDGTHLTGHGYMYIPASQFASFNSARVRIRVFTSNNCTTGATPYNGAIIDNSVTDSWVPLPVAFGTKAGFLSAELQVALSAVGTSNPVVYIDDMYLSDANASAVNLQSVNAQTINNSLFVFVAVGLVVVGSGVVFMRRRRVVGNR